MTTNLTVTKQNVEDVICPENGKIIQSPCNIRCPLDEDIQRTHAMISMLPYESDKVKDAMITIGHEIFRKNPLFTILCGNICGLCEEECNYNKETGFIRRRKIIQPIANKYSEYLKTAPPLQKPTKEKIAIVGGGPSGIMCAYTLAEKGYAVTIFERKEKLGGALRFIPKFRLPTTVLDSLLDNIIRIGHIEVRSGVNIGPSDISLDDLKKEGYNAIYVATGTPNPRILSIESETPEFKKIIQRLVDGDETQGISFGLDLLYKVDRGDVPLNYYKDKKVIVVGGGNVAFDVARTARRLGGTITVMCLENDDKTTIDGIPADIEEIEGAEEEGISIIYSRGVDGIITKDDTFQKIRTFRCTSVYTKEGAFNPTFDHDDVEYIDGDVLLITIGQAPERSFYQGEKLLDERGRLDVDTMTLMSTRREGIFVGGDVKKPGFASEAMRDGGIAAESIDRYLNGMDLKKRRFDKVYEKTSIPKRMKYKTQPDIHHIEPHKRINFDPFEMVYSLDMIRSEARRCLYCGPCKSCKACVVMGFQEEIPEIEVNEDFCSGCGMCIATCNYHALTLKKVGEKSVIELDQLNCKRCGMCVCTCPSGAIQIKDMLNIEIKDILQSVEETVLNVYPLVKKE